MSKRPWYRNLFNPKGRPPKQESFPLLWPINYGGEARWTMVDYENYVNEGFNSNTLIYSSIMYKVRAISQAKLCLSDGYEIVTQSHPLIDLLKKPNRYQNWVQILGLLETYLNVAGNAYLYIIRNNKNIPTSVYLLRPDRVYIVIDSTGIKGYVYRPEGVATPEGIPILLEDIIHYKFPNPGDPYDGLGYGLSPISALAKSGDVDNKITEFLKTFFDKGALPAGLLQYDMPLETVVVQEIKERWRQVYGGSTNWADVGVLDNGAKYTKLGYSFSEIGFEIIDDRNESRVLGPFGVPPILLGTKFGLKSSTFSNFDQARKAFWEDTMSYELVVLETGLNKLALNDGILFKFDTSKVPALAKDIPSLVDSAYKLFSMGVPPKLAFDSVGLYMPQYPNNDIQYVPVNMAKIDETGAPLPFPTSDPTKDLGSTNSFEYKEVKNLYTAEINQVMESVQESEDTVFSEIVSWLKGLKGRVGIVLSSHKSKMQTQKSSVNFTELSESITKVISTSNPLSDELSKSIEKLLGEIREVWSEVLPKLNESEALELLEDISIKYTSSYLEDILNTLKVTLIDDMVKLLYYSEALDESLDKVTTRIFETFDQWVTGKGNLSLLDWSTPPTNFKAEVFTRTEVIRLSNSYTLETFKIGGVETKVWLATGDDRTRRSHRNASGQEVPITSPFRVGESSLMYPGDTSLGAPAQEIVLCRCTLIPKLS